MLSPVIKPRYEIAMSLARWSTCDAALRAIDRPSVARQKKTEMHAGIERMPSIAVGSSVQVGINCLQVDASFVGGVTTYVLGLLEGFAKAGDGCRFRVFVTRSNQHLFEDFKGRDNFEIFVVNDRLLSLRGHISRAALLTHSEAFVKFASDVAFKNIQELMEAE